MEKKNHPVRVDKETHDKIIFLSKNLYPGRLKSYGEVVRLAVDSLFTQKKINDHYKKKTE